MWIGKPDVFGFLDGGQSPLYSMGFDRVGCFPCLAGGDYWTKAFAFDDFGKNQRIKVVQLAHGVKKDVFTSMNGLEKFGFNGANRTQKQIIT